MTERGRIVLGTGVLPAIAAASCYFSARGSFGELSFVPKVVAVLCSVFALVSLARRPRVAFRERLALALVTIVMASVSYTLEARYRAAQWRSWETRGRARLVGRMAPILTYQHALNANARDEAVLADFRGKLVVVDFWATWCPPCLQAMPRLDELQRRFPDRLLVVGVTRLYDRDPGDPDSAAELARIEKVATTRGAHYPIVVADTDQNDSNYQVEGLPTVVIVDPDGRIRAYLVADDRDVVDDAIREIQTSLAR
jgi:thiol-disulfide isomerase/thioredoxin